MNTEILTQLLPASPAPAPSGRGSEAVESAPGESFGQVMSRVGAQPRPEPAGARRDAAPKKADTREPAESKAAEKAASAPAQAKKTDASAEDAAAQGTSTAAPADTVDETETDAPATNAAALIEALLLPAAVGQPATEVPLVPVTSEPTAQGADDKAGPDHDAGATIDHAGAAVRAAPVTSAAQPIARAEHEVDAAADAEADTATAQARAPMIVADATDRRSTTPNTSAAPVLPPAAPQRVPIAEALAALANRSDAGEIAHVVAREHRFDQLLDSRALSAPRADPATQATPFASLLQSTSAPTTVATIASPVGQPGFAQDFGNRVLMLASGQVKSAELALTPAELGPVRVSIELRGQEASIAFAASAAATRAALEEALPRLREMFAQQGLSLLDASVSAHVGQQGQRADGRAAAPRGRGRAHAETDAAVSAVAAPSAAASGRPVRLIDVIA